jgi:ribosomal protein S18 acetylase RimI-like enzyme
MILEFGDGFFLRQALAADRPALCEICLRTGDAGSDATEREDDPELMGMIYAVPYQALEPELAFVIDSGDGPAGYLFGAVDTRAFNARLTAEWYPALQQRVTDPGPDETRWRGSDWARRRIHHPNLTMAAGLLPYSSHGHIDLLPAARGKGIGRQCITYLQQRFRQAGSTGMHLDVHPDNEKARRFYEALGFETLSDPGLPAGSRWMAKQL